MNPLHLMVTETRAETDHVRRIQLSAQDGSVLPSYTPGATLTIDIPGVGHRKYSLVQATVHGDAFRQPSHYILGVRLADDSQGGSRFMHALQVGDSVNVIMLENDFALEDSHAPVLLVAGGIGVTPLVSKAALMKGQGRPFRFVYAARSENDFSFIEEIKALSGPHLLMHADEHANAVLDLSRLFDSVADNESVHICGPRPMLHSAVAEAKKRNWPENKLKFELFYSSVVPDEKDGTVTETNRSGAFEIEIKSTGAVYNVPPDKTIVDVLVEAGLDPLYDCNKGECGVCQVGVLAGEPDHKDYILSESERASNRLIQICISRAKSPRLVLDL